MNSLSFPDINLWIALAFSEHVHSEVAHRWWRVCGGKIAFCRISQLGFLRLCTTSAAMDSKPLTIDDAWKVYDRFNEDDRLVFVQEQAEIERLFCQKAAGMTASPKVWGDAWMLVVAQAAGGELVTLDKALAARGAHYLLAKRG
jgi:toxin-antitoxin system PIN domain toxin